MNGFRAHPLLHFVEVDLAEALLLLGQAALGREHLVQSVGVVDRDESLVVGEAATRQEFHALLELSLGDELARLGVHETNPELNVLLLSRAVIAQQGAHAEELNPRDVDLLLVLRVDAHRLQDGPLDGRMLVLEKRARVQEEVDWDAVVNGRRAGSVGSLVPLRNGRGCRLLILNHPLLDRDVQQRVVLGM